MKVMYPKSSVSHYGKGEQAQSFTPGDFILVHDDTFPARCMSFFQSLFSKDKLLAKWNHCALIANPEGELVELRDGRVKLSSLGIYLHKEYVLVQIDATLEQRRQAFELATNCIGDSVSKGGKVCFWLSILTSLRASFGFLAQESPSGLLVRCLEKEGATFKEDGSHISPSRLAKYYIEANYTITNGETRSANAATSQSLGFV